jgi:hypothetical protein
MEFGKKIMEMMKEGLENFGPQVGNEIARLKTHGSMEAAGSLFNGSAFTPYGPGAYSKDQDGRQKDGAQIEAPQIELEQEQSRGR